MTMTDGLSPRPLGLGRSPTFAKVQIIIDRTKYGLDTEQVRGRPYHTR